MDSDQPIGSIADEIIAKCRQKTAIDEAIVVIEDVSETEVRYANNHITTNGIRRDRELTLILTKTVKNLQYVGIQSVSSVAGSEEMDNFIAQTFAALEASVPSANNEELIGKSLTQDVLPINVDTDHDLQGDVNCYLPSKKADPYIFREPLAELKEVFAGQGKGKSLLSGLMSYGITTTHLATTTDVAFTGEERIGIFEIVKRQANATGDLSSSWIGEVTRDFQDISPYGIDKRLSERLSWGQKKVNLPPGRYEVIMPPSVVADLMLELYMAADGLDAREGGTVFSAPGGLPMYGRRLCDSRFSLYSDPHDGDVGCNDVFVTTSNGSDSSVFDNGRRLEKTYWLEEGVVKNLRAPRYTEHKYGLAPAFHIGNLLLASNKESTSLEDMIRQTKRGLLITCLWYIREVDRAKLLLTGLTRDGVYLVEHGEIVAEVNNFRFNDSPLTLLNNAIATSAPSLAYPRESGEWMPLCKMPAVTVAGFNFDSVSSAS
ncbi:MAG: metallopeptidase TldD-related protein [Firmicutes bacterium]|nr:metallopeptidase TldD-related protein [Bacillota bacterium]